LVLAHEAHESAQPSTGCVLQKSELRNNDTASSS